MKRSYVCLIAVSGCALLGSLSAATGQNAAGDLWQVTSEMAMVGLPIQMPAQTQQVCAKKDWSTPPAGSGPDQTCRSTDFMMSGNTANWKITCQQPTSTGIGQITRNGADAYTGSIRFTTAQGEMTINLTGRRVGNCNNPS